MTALEVIVDGDNGKQTLKEYLRDLLLTLWREGESFSGKRPFGNSGWEFDAYKALITNGFIEGVVDEDGYIDEIDTYKASAYVESLIHEVFE